MKTLKYLTLLLGALFIANINPALADGWALPWQFGLQSPASPTAEYINEFYDLLLVIITAISLFVLVLLVWVVIRYNAKANPEPAKFTHNVVIEVIWTVIPVIILIIIAVPSLKLLYFADRTETPEMTLKVTGKQWFWSYEYADFEDIAFDAYMIADADIDESKGEKRLLSTDYKVVLPTETNIALQITAAPTDVIHSWTVPAFGVKLDAIPGRLNETWVRIEKPGVYYGQCSELCGKDHAYMPIEVHAVPKSVFDAWATLAAEDIDSADIIELSKSVDISDDIAKTETSTETSEENN